MSDLRFRVLDASDASDREAWLRLWHDWPRREVMAHPEYVRAFTRDGDRTVCAVGEHRDGRAILLPLVMRPLAAESWAGDDPRHDVSTPYGYGGPFTTTDRAPDAAWFWREYEAWCRANAVVSTFLRLSLFREQLVQIPVSWAVEPRLPNIVVPLEEGLPAIRAAYTTNLRRSIDRARRAGLAFELDPEGRRLDAFERVYRHTMVRRGARDWYFFPRSFFERLFTRLPRHCVLAHVCVAGEPVSSDLVLCSEESIYYFLGGTDAAYFHLSPNHLLKDEVIAWAIARGKRYYVLGGGYEPGDGVFRYKRSFARNGEIPFRVAHAVHDRDGYEALVAKRMAHERALGRSWSAAPGYFPAYRG